MGLFGYTGTGSEIRNLGLEHGSVTATATGNNAYIGGLVGRNDGTIIASYATASVTGGTDTYTGGLVGRNYGTIIASYATASVTGGRNTGGLVGGNGGSISASYATASVTGGGTTGGLVGHNNGAISASYATASVTGGTGTYTYTGGLVGWNRNSGTITNSYYDSTANAALNAVGFNDSSGTATNVSGKTTAELQAPTTYSTASDAMYYEWNRNIDGDLDTNPANIVWDFGTEKRYPRLRAEWDATSGATVAEFGTPQRFILTDASDVEIPKFSVAENSTSGSLGFIKDTKAGSSPNFSLTSSHFNVHETDGEISVAGGAMLDFEVAVEHLLNIEIGEGGKTFTRNVSVRITNVLEDIGLTDGSLILIRTLEQLDAIRYDLDGDGVPSGDTMGQQAYRDAFGLAAGANHHCAGGCMGYELMNNLDFEDVDSYAAATRNNAWVDPASGGTPGTSGWVPIGSSTLVAFAAIFDGNGHTISNLYINSSASYVGLFGRTFFGSEIRNLGLKHGSVTATGTNTYTGGLVGYNDSTITASYATASVTGSASRGTSIATYTGGLVGYNSGNGGTISASYATASVTGGTGTTSTGGLVGSNGGSISASYATASVTGDGRTGGLVGWNFQGSISASYATASVTGGTNAYAGGLVGYNSGSGTISASYATASVTGGTYASTGGLVGRNEATIIASYATASVTGGTGTGTGTGGLVGYNSGGTITNSYFDSTVNAALNAVGFSNGTVTNVSGKTTAELQAPTTYSTASDAMYYEWNRNIGGDLDTDAADIVWDFGTNIQRPVLRGIDANRDGIVDATDLATQRAAFPPPPPAALSVGTITPNSVLLSWTSYSDANTGFKVFYSETSAFNPAAPTPEGMEFVSVPALAPAATGVEVTGLSPSTAYYFRVAAVNGAVVGVYATAVPATTEAAMLTLLPAMLDFTAAGETKSVTIMSNVNWSATSNASWLTISGTAMGTGNGSISVVATEQAAAVARTATITVETTGGLRQTVSVTQAAAVEALTLSDASLAFTAAGETKQLTITSNASWTVTSTATWLTLPTGGTEDEVIDVVAAEQTAAVARMATITVVTTGGLRRTVSVTQAAAAEALTLSDASLSTLLRVPEGESTLLVYPNPTSDWVQVVGISSTRTYAYKVYSLVGQEVLSGNVHGDALIDMSSFSDGQYIFILQGHGEEMRTRVLVLK